jgi:dUTP pyrophosphatase
MNTLLYMKTSNTVPTPYYALDGDCGLDLTLMSKTEEGRYSTGIIIAPEHGYHVELVARSSLHKKGYMLANSIGIIDGNYRGIIEVALFKFDKDAPELELPCRGVQIIVRKTERVLLKEFGVLNSTIRGNGGFGSTN